MKGYNHPYRGKKSKNIMPQLYFYIGLALLLCGVATFLFAPLMQFFAFALLGAAAFAMLYSAAMYGMTLSRISAYASTLRYILLAVLAMLLVSFLLIETLIISGGRTSQNAENADYLIVLGAGVNGDTPSLSLQSRIDAAYDYLLSNPDTIAVLSGGQGKGENITEAEAMRRSLMAKGIENERLVLERYSTSTVENIANSLRYITSDIEMPLIERDESDAMNTEYALMIGDIDTDVGNAKITVLSNDFHIFRARLIAGYEGVAVETYSAPTPRFDLVITYHIREYFAVLQSLVYYTFTR